jgi:hypothetical protein
MKHVRHKRSKSRRPTARVLLRQVRLRNRQLEAAIIQAIEECWDSRLPFYVLERALAKA